MKTLVVLISLILSLPLVGHSQEFDPEKEVVIEMTDGTRFTGKIVSSDPREVILRTTDRGDIALPKYSIKSIRDFELGDDQHQDLFATRYFITTNGIPIREGESYINWTIAGPDIQFGVRDNLSLGLMTTWWASPVILSVKRTFDLGERRSAAIGVLGGGTIWQAGGGGILPYASYTMGDRTANFTTSAGYAYIGGQGESFSRAVLSFAGMNKVTRNGTFVFDSMIFFGGDDISAYIIPGIRLQTEPNKAFQFGFGGVVTSEGTFPVPFVSWFRAF